MFTFNTIPHLIIGGDSGALSLFDLKAQASIFRQRDVPLKSEITKILPLASSKFLVLNADQNLGIYEVGKSKKGKPELHSLMSKCLYLDEIIDIKGIEYEDGSG